MYLEDKGMPFLIIGGHAVNAYGLARQTGDIDLLVPGENKADWDKLLVRLGYQPGQSDQHFARYTYRDLAGWPIDLMFVDGPTFVKMAGEARAVTIGDAEVRVVSINHLIMLKIHALKNYQPHRDVKDFNDLVSLLALPECDLSDGDLRSLCERYAGPSLYARIRSARGGFSEEVS